MPQHEEMAPPTALSEGANVARPWLWRYGIALGVVVIGWSLREGLTGWVGQTALPFVFFFPAVACATWFGGLGPGVFASLLSAATARFFFIEPIHSFVFLRSADVAADVAFLFSCVFIVGAIEMMHRSRRRLLWEVKERGRLATELTYARDSLATTLKSIGDGVIVTNASGEVTFLNAESERLTGWTVDEAKGQTLATVFRIVNEDTRKPVENPAAKALRAGRTVGLANHTVLIAKDGTETPIADSAAPIRGPEGAPVGVVLVFRDVSEQREAETARQRLATIVENSGDAIFTKDLQGIITTWNAGAEHLFGYQASEVIGQSITRLVPPDLIEEEQRILERLSAGLPSARLETVRLAKDGRRLYVSISVSPLLDREKNVTGASTIIHDISQRKEAEMALELARQRLVDELGGMRRLHQLGTLLLNESDLPRMLGRVLDASVELLRAKRGVVQLYDVSDDTLKVVAQVGFSDDFIREFQSLPAGGHFVVSAAFQRKQRVIVSNFATDPTFGSRHPDATRHGIAASQSTPLFAADRGVFGVLSTYFNTPHHPSERELRFLDLYAQQAERVIDQHLSAEAVRRAQEELARVNAGLEGTVRARTAELQAMVSELEHVSYAITHDMRAPLRAMSTFAQLLLEDAKAAELPPKMQEYCRRITTGASRLDTLIREALNYTRAVLQRLPMRAVDLDPLVRGLLETYPNLHPEKADIRIEGRLPAVQGNESLLTQCFSSLLGNAVKFVPADRRPEVRVWAETRAPAVRIHVRDNGIGIPRHAQHRLFGMFQKLDTQHEGTGMGLAIVRKLVEQMGGAVGVESEAGQGSSFWIELPPAAPENAA